MAKVLKSEVVQSILDLFPGPTAYLEVGVSKATTFDPIRATRKVAVDPAFLFEISEAKARNPNAEYHQMTSDRYFGEVIQDSDAFDVIYLDGLHTFEQILRDFTNALCFLKKGGVIVINEVYPVSYVASLSSIRAFKAVKKALNIRDKAWMGDVYRLVYFIDSFFQQMTFRTVQDNHGQLVVWERRRREIRERTIESVARTTYEGMVLDKSAMRFAPFANILFELRESKGVKLPPPYVACEAYFSSRPGLTLLRGKSRYLRKIPELINAELATPTIARGYAEAEGRAPDEGVAIFQDATVFGAGMIMTSDKEIVHELVENPRFAPGGVPLDPPKETFEEAISFCKVGISNYGHFLVEMLPRLLANDQLLPRHVPILLHKGLKQFGPRMMEAAGIDMSRIRLVSDAPVHVKKLYWPMRNSFHPFNTSPHAISTLRLLGNQLAPSPSGGGRKLFLSRRDAATRHLLNDSELYERLKPLGFEWVMPGEMAFAEQIATFKSSSTVVSVCGAALTNMVFLPPRSDVVMLTAQTAAGFWFWDLAHHVDARFTVIFGRNEDRSVRDKNANFRIALDDVLRVCQRGG